MYVYMSIRKNKIVFCLLKKKDLHLESEQKTYNRACKHIKKKIALQHKTLRCEQKMLRKKEVKHARNKS